MQDLSIEKIDAVRAAIEQAATVQEIKHALNVASAAQVYAQQSKAGKEVELRVSSAKLIASIAPYLCSRVTIGPFPCGEHRSGRAIWRV